MFIESCKPERNQYTDYFIWTDSSWKWEIPGYRVISGYSQRDGCYISNFFYFQPALNYGFANPDPAHPWQQPMDAPGPLSVRQEIKNIIRYWLNLGASGFRVDMAGWLVKGDPGSRGTMKIWQEIRAWLDEEYPGACLFSEWGNPSLAIQAGFHADFCLPFGMPGYTALLRKPYGRGPGNDPYGVSFFDSSGHGNIKEFLDDYMNHYETTHGMGHIILPTGNHDINPRVSKGRTIADLKLVYLFILTMPGIPAIWYGDEIGMRSVDSIASKEGGYNRTGSRTPMQWDDSRNAGFSTAAPEYLYLPIDPEEQIPSVLQQQDDPDSLLHCVRVLSEIRHTHTALQASSKFEVLFAQPGVCPLVYLRSNENESLIVAINPSDKPVETTIPAISINIPQTLFGFEDAISIDGECWKIHLSGFAGGIYQVKRD